ncbi:hypothetical protein CSW58_08220 [Caulobacter sp. B11]|uniref:hypothetical protein n=1 Tax=Caulobacter sp. B11 TaxID=2048899 RepID=UPI000C12D8F4|nr:hypothetical protein [Caulobacter sp. B11]PHY13070.1 hypothetical protein CSW58_08220 [Caulobacter sp. B11]
MTSRLFALVAGLALAAPLPVLAQTLALKPADLNLDGVVSSEEAALWIARPRDTPELAVPRPASAVTAAAIPSTETPGALSMDRRLVPASGFEQSVEARFEKAIKDDPKKKRY